MDERTGKIICCRAFSLSKRNMLVIDNWLFFMAVALLSLQLACSTFLKHWRTVSSQIFWLAFLIIKNS
ncbi:hypothetical protein SUGI_0485910 [Cryptomeria japonica]|nr:hypothetical protein SUGI_0485910 [Cryptomeria japonica]